MEAKLLVTRTRSSSDERIVNIALTQNGKALQIKAANVPAQLIEAMNVTVEELQELKNIISKISNKNNKK
jgi:DNA-binding MarR family transcriptional regulator